MLFPTATFATFFVVVLCVVWGLAGHPTARKWALVTAGGVFYAYWDVRFLGLLAWGVVASWAFARAIGRSRHPRVRTAWMWVGVAVALGLLGFFKYYGFFVESVVGGLEHLGVHLHPRLLEVALPVGISFSTFQQVSYLVDVRRDRIAPARLLDVATWLTFFPILISGPITRATEFVPQLGESFRTARVDTGRAFWLIARGLLKKLVVASFLATAITDGVLADPARYNSVVLLVGVYAYAAQIYTDFSGYTDMAIGLGLLLGFRVPENFDRPYTATSVQDFWSRWHMTLSRWLRDYLFAPIAGRRPGVRVYAGIVGVMLLAGLWHGAAWTFVLFGGVHGVAMAMERWSRERRRRQRRRPAPRTAGWLVRRRAVTFHVVCLGWVFFSASSVGAAVDLLRRLVTNWTVPVTSLTPLLLLTVAGVLAVQYLPADWAGRVRTALEGQRTVVQVGGFAVALVVILALAPTTVPAFIYFRF